MKNPGPSASAIGLVLSLLLTACGSGGSGSGGSTGGGDMFIQTCSLGCGNGSGGVQVSCAIVQIAVNKEIDVFFSEPIDPASVSSSSFQLISLPFGQAPIGTRFLDPSNPKKLVFRPAITFDALGNVTFGFNPLTTYRITIQGTAQNDAGPFIRSVAGKNNQSRMQCDIRTTNQVDDLVAGPPVARVLVELAIPGPPVDDHTDFQSADGAVDVWRSSPIKFTFNDIMNPLTLINPVTHEASLITVLVDSDGDLTHPEDQVTLFGQYVVNIDLQHLSTEMIFTPANGMPSGGNGPPFRVVIITVPSTVQDLAGNGVSNSGARLCTPEVIPYDPIVLPDADGENFTNATNEDTANSGADWGQGKLTQGWGGGSGRLGSLRVPTLQTVTLQTTGTVFKNQSALDPATSLPIVATTGIIDNSRPADPPLPPNGYSPRDTLAWPTATVTDGIFEFSSLTVENGGILKVIGTKHARLFSRGPVTINGTIDVRGDSSPAHSSNKEIAPFDASGGPGAQGGPGAGSGGKGGDRPDNTDSDILFLIDHGIENPGAVVKGGRGMGVGRSGTLAAGKGGINNPNPFPTTTFTASPNDRGGSLYSDVDGQSVQNCTIMQVASPGGGGGYATDGSDGVPLAPLLNAINPTPPPLDASNLPTAAAGGDSAEVGLEPPDPQSGHVIRLLDATRNLRGGSGGGGGGANLFGTYQDALQPPDCYYSPFGGITNYFDHSGAGAGGGGGAVQVVSGMLINVAGSITAVGGNGGSSINDPANDPIHHRGSRASPGGAGSGGAVRLQAKTLNILDIDPNDPNAVRRIDVSGGLGGVNLCPGIDPNNPADITLGRGGAGGAGLMRLEDLSGGTSPPATLLTRCSEAPKFLPFDPIIDPNTPPGPCFGFPESEMILSVGPWNLPSKRPETFSGAVSCWMRPVGQYFTLGFTPDDLSASPPAYGWNMDVVFHDTSSGLDVLTTYRGRDANTPFGSGDFESNLGSSVNYLNAANPPGNQFGTGPYDPSAAGTYLTVRFQGALAVSDISGDPCHVVLAGNGTQIAGRSLTPWVRHPAELNEFLPRPNMIRFCVVFDRSLAVPPTVPSLIRGVTNLLIHAQPD